MQQVKSKWVAKFSKSGAVKMRLFCFPYAGGNAQVFKAWGDQLPSTIEVCGIQPPGRSSRFTEPAFTDLEAMLGDLTAAIKPFLDKPFAFFGHSLGAAVSYELARRLQSQGFAPQIIFPSGRTAPHMPRKKPPIHHLPEDEFVDELKKMNGTPHEILANEELMELMVPMLRADFAMSDTYTFKPGTDLTCPMVAFGGVDDPDVDEESVRGWGEHAGGSFNYHMLPGDHFFLQGSQDQLLKLLMGYLGKHLS